MASDKESHDDYIGIVVTLNDRWRVIDSMEKQPYKQWILQYNESIKQPNRWTTSPPYGSFCQSREVLFRCIKEKCGDINPEAYEVLSQLDSHIAAML